jgi:hypothetical protein
MQTQFCKLGTKHGILTQLYTKIQFTICEQQQMNLKGVLDEEPSLRECAKKMLLLCGQGYKSSFFAKDIAS